MSETEMLREYERLKRENELLRQSNVLLQAAAGPSSSFSSAAPTSSVSSSLVRHPSPPIHHTSYQPPVSVQSAATTLTQTQPGETAGIPLMDSRYEQRPQPADVHSLAHESHRQPSTDHTLGIESDRASNEMQQGGERSEIAATEVADHGSCNQETTHTAVEARTSVDGRDTRDGDALAIKRTSSGSEAVKMELCEDSYYLQQAEAVEWRMRDLPHDDSDRNAAQHDGSHAIVNDEHVHVSRSASEFIQEPDVVRETRGDEDNDKSVQSHPSHEAEPSQDDGAGQKKDEGDEDDEVEYETSQEVPVRGSTIDRGNYDQYKAARDDDTDTDGDDEDEAEDDGDDGEEEETKVIESGDVDMIDAVQDATSGTAGNEVWNAGASHREAGHFTQDNTLSRVRESADGIGAVGPALALAGEDMASTSSSSDHGTAVSSGSHMGAHETASRSSQAAGEDQPMQSEEVSASTVHHHIERDDTAAVKVEAYDEPFELPSDSSLSKSNTKNTRRRVRAISSSDSETECDDDNGDEDESDSDESEDEDADDAGDDGILNGLEAALKAAAGSSATNVRKTTSPKKAANARQSHRTFSLEATKSSDRVKFSVDTGNQAKKKRSRTSDQADSDSETAGTGKRVARPTPQHGNGASIIGIGGVGNTKSSSSSSSSVKSSLLWPTLDDFYDFVLDLSPRRIEVSQRHQATLRRYSRGTLPATYPNLNEYTSVQIEAIMEELVASLRSSEQTRSQHNFKSLQLTSVSPCGRGQGNGQQTSFLDGQRLTSSTIFMESGFSGLTSNNHDYILTFQPQLMGKKGSSSSSSGDFASGDLVFLQSPRWKDYELIAYGVVLCNSVVAVDGGGSDGRGGGGNRGSGHDNDLVCVLVRTQKRDYANPKENFSVLTEMCLANQRSPKWKWRLGYVHNLTTSAREFQAMKSVSFFSPATKRSLLEGTLNATDTERAAAKQQQQPQSREKETGKDGKAASSSANIAAGALGSSHSVKKPSRLAPALLKELERKYNSSQLDAILGCIGDENHVIIQGPPGTGKTKTILGVLSALLDGAAGTGSTKAKESTRIRVGASLASGSSATTRTVAETSVRILVAAPSNAAVDELIVRLLSEGVYDGTKCCSYRPRIVRVGRPESLPSQQSSSKAKGGELQTDSKKIKKAKWRKYAKEVEEILLESLVTKHKNAFPNARVARQGILKSAQVVFCTLSGAGSVGMCDFAHEFDALVIDEAAQAVEASALIPFKFRPRRVVLVGDHRQLPATVISKKLLDMGYDRSLFQRFVENGSRVFLLDRQYRMHPSIAAFPSSYFYSGKLVQDAKMEAWTARKYHASPLFEPFVFYDVAGGQQSQVSGSKSLRNLPEVDFILLLVRRLLQQFPEMDWRKKIGIIAPYKQQVYELAAHLERLEHDVGQQLEIEVNTVDGFQGREKEIIIYSCVRTSSGKRRHQSSGQHQELDAFWADERRMNVAITRAKSSLWIVGNARLLEQSRAWRALIRAAKDRKRYLLSTDAGL